MAAATSSILRGTVALALLLSGPSAMHGRGRTPSTPRSLRRATKELEMNARLQQALPVKWLHVPRSGSSFLNIMMHHERICPDFPQEVVLVRSDEAVDGNYPDAVKRLMADDPTLRVEAIHGRFWNRSGYSSMCHGLLQPSGHNAVGGTASHFRRYSGKLMTMMRQPEHRLLSAYDFGRMGCWGCGDKVTEPEFAEKASGCVTKMLARSAVDVGAPCLKPSPHPTHREIRRAQERLVNHFAFVGIVEEWQLSICLFHSMFGGKCKKVELVDVHPGIGAGAAGNISRLAGFTDPYDGPLYEIAKQRFRAKVAEYKLTYARCRAMCE